MREKREGESSTATGTALALLPVLLLLALLLLLLSTAAAVPEEPVAGSSIPSKPFSIFSLAFKFSSISIIEF